jgi:hypothetical protein
VITLFFYLFAIVLPALKSYRGYMLPLNLALAYLWLTSLIFTSQDWSGGRCGGYYCALKHTVQAFYIIGLCVSPASVFHRMLTKTACFSSSTPSWRP